MTLKELFDQAEDGKLSYDEFMEMADAGEAKFVDLSEGNYVSKQKYEDELEARVKEIETLNGTISTRDTDLAELQKQLEAAGTDAQSLADLSSQFETLKGKYDNEVKSYKDQLRKQAYEFAVKERASGKTFSSDAARRDYISQLVAKDFKMEDGRIIGADDFDAIYAQNNADAFVVNTPEDDFDLPPSPHFVDTTQGGEPPVDPTGGFLDAFNFTPVHPMPVE